MDGHIMGTMTTFAAVLRWLQAATPGTLIPAAELARQLAPLVEAPEPEVVTPTSPAHRETWRERLWVVPAETRLGVREAAEALGRPRSYVYARTGPASEDPIPHRKLDGTVLFTAGELRAWIRDREEVVHGGRMESTAAERHLRSA